MQLTDLISNIKKGKDPRKRVTVKQATTGNEASVTINNDDEIVIRSPPPPTKAPTKRRKATENKDAKRSKKSTTPPPPTIPEETVDDLIPASQPDIETIEWATPMDVATTENTSGDDNDTDDESDDDDNINLPSTSKCGDNLPKVIKKFQLHIIF